MLFDNNEREDHDFFDGPDIPDTPKEPERPAPRPDNPDYWEEESEWEHLRPLKRWKVRFYGILSLIAVVLLIWLLIWMFRPYADQSTQFGYVDGIEYRGTLFKTYEGELLPYKEIHDTTRLMKGNFVFSTPDAKLAKTLKALQLKGKPARVQYTTYHSAMPWRGETKTVVVAVDSVDPATILPPDWR